MSKADDTKKPIQISVDDIDKKEFEKTRLEMYCVYNTNNQNHSAHSISTIVALIGFFAGGITFLENLVAYALISFLIGIFFLGIYFWLLLRGLFWSAMATQILVLTKIKIVQLFNEYNNKNMPYEIIEDTKNEPPYTAILQYAVIQQISKIESKKKWYKDPLNKLAFRTNNAVRREIQDKKSMQIIKIGLVIALIVVVVIAVLSYLLGWLW